MNTSSQNNHLAEMKSLVEKASASTNYDVLLELSLHPNMSVRRAVARNIHTPSSVLNALVYDVTVNVCFKALENRNCVIKRKLPETSLIPKCVTCEVKEIDTFVKCSSC